MKADESPADSGQTAAPSPIDLSTRQHAALGNPMAAMKLQQQEDATLKQGQEQDSSEEESRD